MKKIKFKAVAGQVFKAKWKLEAELAANPEVHLQFKKDTVVMYVSSPDKQPGETCNCSGCRSTTYHNFLVEDKIVMLWDPEENLIKL